jgi:hypothetical protein
VLADQGAPTLPEPMLMIESGVNRCCEQPWQILWRGHRHDQLVGSRLVHAFKRLRQESYPVEQGRDIGDFGRRHDEMLRQ